MLLLVVKTDTLKDREREREIEERIFSSSKNKKGVERATKLIEKGSVAGPLINTTKSSEILQDPLDPVVNSDNFLETFQNRKKNPTPSLAFLCLSRL